jgi:hypothetical protein
MAAGDIEVVELFDTSEDEAPMQTDEVQEVQVNRQIRDTGAGAIADDDDVVVTGAYFLPAAPSLWLSWHAEDARDIDAVTLSVSS